MTGFFAATAPQEADVVLVVELALGIALVGGLFLARSRHYRIHGLLQSSIVLVNIPIILAWMVPSYLSYVVPAVPGHLGHPFYLLPSMMLAVGLSAELLGIYVILVAGTRWVPPRLRFTNYKLWMRTVLGLWWGVLILGLLTYYYWYVSTG